MNLDKFKKKLSIARILHFLRKIPQQPKPNFEQSEDGKPQVSYGLGFQGLQTKGGKGWILKVEVCHNFL